MSAIPPDADDRREDLSENSSRSIDDQELEHKQRAWKREEVKKDAMRVLQKLPIVLIVAYLIFQTYHATTEYTESRIEDRYEFEDSLEIYQQQIVERVEMRNSQLDVDVNKLGVTEILDEDGVVVTTGNFEGPQLFIEALEFEDQIIDVIRNPGIQDYSITSLLFDPDHSELGLPDLDVKVSPVKIYEPEQGKLKAVLEGIKDMLPGRTADDAPKPYAVYTKDVKLADGTLRKVAMQLWLTEFNVTIGVKPDLTDARKFGRQEEQARQEREKQEKERIDLEIERINARLDANAEKLKGNSRELDNQKKDLDRLERDEKQRRKELDKNQERLIRRETRRRQAKVESIQFAFDTLQARISRQQQTVDSLASLVDSLGALDRNLEDSIRQLNAQDRSMPGVKYPAFWYSQGGDSIAVDKLRAENDNQQYNNVKVWLRVVPNAAPWYVKTQNAENLRPRMAIGAIYCTEVINDVLQDTKYKLEKDDQEPNLNVMQGIAVGLFENLNFRQPLISTPHQQEITPLRSGRYYLNQSDNTGIWDKPYYMKIFLRNIGTYKSDRLIFKKNTLKEYDDQLTFHFLMPLLVRGSWDIIPPNEVIPDWNPPRPRTLEGFQLRHLLPTWGLSFFGRTISFILMVMAVLLILFFFFPGLKELLSFLVQQVVDVIKGLITWIRGLFKKAPAEN